MSKVTARDYQTLQKGLRDLYAHHDLDTLPRTAVRLAKRLVANDQTTYNEIDPHRQRLAAVTEPIERQDDVIRMASVWEEHMHQHPLVNHFYHHPADEPKKISDFLSDVQFRKLPLYTEFFKLIDVNYQIVTTMPAPRPLMVGIALNRETRDFSERDRAVLAMLQPHLRQAYENAALITDLSGEVGRVHDALDRMDRGLILFDEQGRVHRASPAAVRFSADHFGDEADASLSRRLPDTLSRWALVQVAALRQVDGAVSRPQPLIRENHEGRLVMRVTTDHEPGLYLLAMHRATPLTSPEPLQGLGLTTREAEALFGVIEGGSNPAIAEAMGISERTVQKHLENTYRKLGVPGRAAAIVKALEWVRL